MTFRRFSFGILALLPMLVSAPVAYALTNGLALTPQMGWNDWNSFSCGISETDVITTANIIATNGMKAAGYQFVNIDDGWASLRDSNGVIQAYSVASKFPDGIQWLANYVHSRGLKLGIYTDHGINTCSRCINTNINPVGKQPGSFGYEYVDAFTYGSWGVDYLKNDSCNLPPNDVPMSDYLRMADGLMKSGQPILNSLCPNAAHYEYWSPDAGNSWRTTGDIHDTFASMIGRIDQNSKSAYLAGPGRWNDPDMLEIGNNEFATNLIAARTHFTMWCVMAAPLIAGNKLATMSAQTLAVLTNAEAIAVDQDPAGEQGIRVAGSVASGEVWSKPLGYDFTTRAVALFNRSTTTATNITCYWTNLALQAGTATVRDLWAHTDLGAFTDRFTTNVPAEGVVFLKVVGTPLAPPPLGTNYLSDLPPVYAYVGSGTMTQDKSINGNTLTLNGTTYNKGLGVFAISGIEYNLGGIASRFQSDIGVDDEVGAAGSVIFQVIADGTKIYDSGIMTNASTTKTIDLDITGVRRLTLGVTDTGNDVTGSRNSNDHADWAGARIVLTNATPKAPYPPTGLAASPGNVVTLTWNNAVGAISYNVKRGTNSGGPYALVGTAPIAVFADTNVLLGTNYYYVVSAVSSLGESANSGEAAATPCSPPAAPTNVTTVVNGSQVTVRWNAVPGATGYNVIRFGPATPPVVIASGLSATNYTDATVLSSTNYYYLVAAANACNQGALSVFVPAIIPPSPPAAPTGLSAAPGSTVVNLTWTAPSGAISYKVKRATVNGGPYSVIVSNVVPTTYLDSGLSNGTTYYYVVSAVNAGGEGPDSAQVSAVPAVPATAYWTNTVTSAAQNWNVNANWTNTSLFPNTVGVLAVVNAAIAANQTINLNQAITIGALLLGDTDGSAAYTLAANGGSLTFSSTNAAILTEPATSKGDTIAAPVTLNTNLIIINNSANTLTLAGAISGSGAMTISNGTVQIGDGSTNGGLGVNATDNGALIFSRSDNFTVGTVISGTGTVTKKGAGVLTLSGANTFSGGATVAQGTLKIGIGSALGVTNSGTIVSNGATLDMNHIDSGLEPVTVSGAGVNNNGAMVDNSGSGNYVSPQIAYVTLTGDTVFGGTGRWDLRSNPNNANNAALNTGGHAYKVTKTGGNQVSIVGVVVDSALGDIDVQQGLMGWETTTTSMGNPASNLFVRAGATLSFYSASTHWNKNFVLYGNGASTNMYNWSGANIVIGRVQLNSNCVFSCNGTSLTLSNVLSGAGGLVKNLGSPLILAATNTYSGATAINAGTLTLTGSGSISNSPTITIASGATLDGSVHGGGGITLAGGQTLTGYGAVNGNLTAGPGSTLAPGGSIGLLTFNNSLTLAGGSTTIMELSKSPVTNNDVAQVTGTVTYGGTLVATNISASALAAGDSFKLFNAAACTGSFTNLVPASPGAGLAWNTNGLTNGTLAVMVWDFGVGATPVSRTTQAGGSVSYTATLTPTNGFNGNVTLGAGGLPAGASAGFDPNPVNGSASSTLTVTASNTVAAGNYLLTITGSSGSLAHNTNVTFSVTDFGVAASPSAQAVQASSGTNYTVTVGASNGFSGTVTLSVSGLPTGIGYALSPTNVNGSGASTLSLNTSNNVLPGDYLLTISGTSGSLTHTGAVTLSVNDFTLAAAPASQAVQVGDGANFTVTLGASNGFTGTVTLNVGGLPAEAGYSLSATNVNGSGTAVLSVSTSNGIAAGDYDLTVFGTSGSLTHTGAVTLSVNDFTVVAAPASQAVQAGDGAQFTVTVGASNGFTGTVTLSVSGLPAEANYNLAPTNVNGSGTATLDVSTATNVAAGSYPLIVTGLSGDLVRTGAFTLIVQEPTTPNLVWNGTNSGEWDIGLTTNWLDLPGFVMAVFGQGDTVLFDDTPGMVTDVTLGAGVAVQPAGVTVDAGTNNYGIGGAGRISGPGGIVKRGVSTLTLMTTNDFTGDTLVEAGTLALSGGGSVDGSGTIRVDSGAVLDSSGRGDGTLTLANGQTLEGAGTLNGSLIAGPGATVAAGTNAIGTLTVTGNVMLGGTTVLKLDAQNGTNDVIGGAASISYGGTLRLTNLGGALNAGDSFQLFVASNYAGAFSNLVPVMAGSGLMWDTGSLSNGLLGVVTAPQPHIDGLRLSGTNVIFWSSNGVATASYYVWTTTNVDWPLSNWSIVATGWFDSRGYSRFTNPAAPNSRQRFFLLQMQ